MSKKSAFVTFLGSPGTASLDYRGPVMRTFPLRFSAGNPVLIDGGAPFMCMICNKMYDEAPEKCANVVTKIQKVGVEPNTKRIYVSNPCGSKDFVGDIEMEHFREMARLNPDVWKFEETGKKMVTPKEVKE